MTTRGHAADRPLRVAMVIQRFRPHFSGQGAQLEVLCRELAARGHAVTILTSAYDCASSIEETPGVRIVRLRSGCRCARGTRRGRRLVPLWFAMQVLLYLLRRPRFDLVHVHTLTDALYAAWAWGRLRRRPVVFEMTLAGVDDAVTVLGKRQRLQRVRNHIVRTCDGYVAISPALAAAYREAGLPADRLRLIPQGVDLGLFRPAGDRTVLRRELALPAAGPLVLFVGSLIRRKGIDVLLRSWAEMRTGRPEAHLLLVGRDRFDEPEAADFLESELARLAPADADAVHRIGVRDDVHRFMQAADVFVFPSRQEGFGTVMIEAMACGLPCVVAELPGITDYIFGPDRTGGRFVPQDDARALADAVVSLLADAGAADRSGRAGLAAVRQRFAIATVADRYVAFHRELLCGQNARSDG